MNQFFDKFAKQPLSVKLVALGIIVGVIGALYYQVWYVPQQEALQRLKKKSAELNVKLAENKAIAENYTKFQEEVNILNEELKQAVALLPNEADIQAILRQLSIVSKKTNVDLMFFKPGGESKKGFYSEIPMDIKVAGTFHDLVSFMDQVGKLSRIINLSNIVFSGFKPVKNQILMEIDCRATTFVFQGGT